MTSFFIAQRILFAHHYQKSISTMTIVCFIGIFIASFALALTTAIMNGFEKEIHTTMQGIRSDIIIDTSSIVVDMDIIGAILKEFPEIKAFSPTINAHILIRNNKTKNISPAVALLKAIDPEKEQFTSSIANKITTAIPNQIDFPTLFNDNTLVIGKQLAHFYGISVNDSLEVLYMRDEEMRGKKVIFDTKEALVSGIFSTGIEDYDASIVYASLSFLESLYPNATIDQINISVLPPYDHTLIIQKLKSRLGLPVYSWKDLYPSLVASLKLEKYVSFFIIALILLVASMNSISLVFMHITQKRSEIALLKALGMKNSMIRSIFFILSIMISSLASLSALLLSVVVGYFLQRYPIITLPDVYYVTYLPIDMDIVSIIMIFCLVVVLSILATIIPLKRIKAITIAQILRFEG